MTTLYLICAAQSEGVPYRILEGQLNTDLSPLGRRQLYALRDRFADLHLDAVYTSDLYRAEVTAQMLSRQPVRCADLRELDLGPWQGELYGNVAYDNRDKLNCLRTNPGNWRLGGAELPEEAADRLVQALHKIAAQHADAVVAVVSHPIIIRLAAARLRGSLDLTEAEAPSASVTVLTAEHDALQLQALWNTDHLQAAGCHEPKTLRKCDDPNTDIFAQPLRWVEHSGIMAQCVECVWEEMGEDRPFCAQRLIEDAARNPTTVAFAEYDLAGFLQLSADYDWITLLCAHPGCRRQGLGTQLVGQAVWMARKHGLDALYVALPPGNPYADFFLHLGFVPDGITEEGRDVLMKDLRLL